MGERRVREEKFGKMSSGSSQVFEKKQLSEETANFNGSGRHQSVENNQVTKLLNRLDKGRKNDAENEGITWNVYENKIDIKLT